MPSGVLGAVLDGLKSSSDKNAKIRKMKVSLASAMLDKSMCNARSLVQLFSPARHNMKNNALLALVQPFSPARHIIQDKHPVSPSVAPALHEVWGDRVRAGADCPQTGQQRFATSLHQLLHVWELFVDDDRHGDGGACSGVALDV